MLLIAYIKTFFLFLMQKIKIVRLKDLYKETSTDEEANSV